MKFLTPSHLHPEPERKPGEIERHADGRPKIYSPCAPCEGTGKVPSPKTGNLIKCKPCDSTGIKGAYYTRTTTFIDVLEDKSNLSAWKRRMAAVGLTMDPSLFEQACGIETPLSTEGSRAMDRILDRAHDKADTKARAELGTALHEVTEDLDAGKDPGFVPEELAEAVASYREAMRDIEVVAIEQFGVHDGYRVAGTLDRLLRVRGDVAKALGVRSGTVITGDLKTGRIDYGFAKIPMQVAFYAHMERYDPETHERSPINVDGRAPSKKVGLLIHTPSDGGSTTLYPLDLTTGWRRVALAAQVREARLIGGRKASRPEPIREVLGADFV